MEKEPTRSGLAADGGGKRGWGAPVMMAISCWICVAAGFVGLRILIQERPQFVGDQIPVQRNELVQESPSILLRKVNDDMSVVRAAQPEGASVAFNMTGRSDYRGLKTIVGMEGHFRGQYSITNTFEEPAHVLFRCGHPKGNGSYSQGLNTSGLELKASLPGIQETISNAWVWTGMLEPQKSVQILIAYNIAAVSGVRYLIHSGNGVPISSHRTEISLDGVPSAILTSAEGRLHASGGRKEWLRSNFLPPEEFSAHIAETRSLYGSLVQLLEIGPLISLLFMISALSLLSIQRRLTSLQVFTITVAYAFYFPLILYLSAKFRFGVALFIAFTVPGLLLLNYVRWLAGLRIGVTVAAILLLSYQIFPTLATFAGWNRGLVLLCLGGVTLFVVMCLQNIYLRTEMRVAAASLLLLFVQASNAQEAHIILQGRVVQPNEVSAISSPLVSFHNGQYVVTLTEHFADVEASVDVESFKAGEQLIPIFDEPVHIRTRQLLPFVRHISIGHSNALQIAEPGKGTIRLTYRVPLLKEEGEFSATIPLLKVPSAVVQIRTSLANLAFENANVWKVVADRDGFLYELGTVGTKHFTVRSSTMFDNSRPGADPGAGFKNIYGIQVLESQHLTVVNSDGTCTHFAEFLLSPSHPDVFEIKIPHGSQIISLLMNGIERTRPSEEAGSLQVQLDTSVGKREKTRISVRLKYPEVRLGFIGFNDFEVPQPNSTVGTLNWTLALPAGFRTQIISSTMEQQQQQSDLSVFGDYGKILMGQTRVSFAKNLQPPSPVKTRLKYYQDVTHAASYENKNSPGR